MLIINPLKPFYIDKENKIIRMGNFKNKAKEIEFEDDSLIKLFNYVLNPISREELIKRIVSETELSVDEIDSAIDYLMSEGFIIKYDDYNKISNNDRLNRQYLYFSMCSDKIKNWNLKKQPNILILGLGGVGSNVSIILSRAGITSPYRIFEKFKIWI